jgi:hypothetical protein
MNPSITFTDEELEKYYGNGMDQIGLLPSTAPSSSDVDTTGLLTENALKTTVNNLVNTGILPLKPGTNTNVYEEKQKALMNHSLDEFDFYYKRYRFVLEKLFETLQEHYTTPTDQTKLLVDKRVQQAKMLNQKLNQLIQIMVESTNQFTTLSQQMSSKVKEFKENAEKQKEKLQHQYKMFSSSEASVRLNKEMVKYTEEKARYTDNLLKLYSVLNVVALGLLFYVFRSSPSS